MENNQFEKFIYKHQKDIYDMDGELSCKHREKFQQRLETINGKDQKKHFAMRWIYGSVAATTVIGLMIVVQTMNPTYKPEDVDSLRAQIAEQHIEKVNNKINALIKEVKAINDSNYYSLINDLEEIKVDNIEFVESTSILEIHLFQAKVEMLDKHQTMILERVEEVLYKKKPV